MQWEEETMEKVVDKEGKTVGCDGGNFWEQNSKVLKYFFPECITSKHFGWKSTKKNLHFIELTSFIFDDSLRGISLEESR